MRPAEHDQREGLGCVAWTLAAFAIVAAVGAFYALGYHVGHRIDGPPAKEERTP